MMIVMRSDMPGTKMRSAHDSLSILPYISGVTCLTLPAKTRRRWRKRSLGSVHHGRPGKDCGCGIFVIRASEMHNAVICVHRTQPYGHGLVVNPLHKSLVIWKGIITQTVPMFGKTASKNESSADEASVDIKVASSDHSEITNEPAQGEAAPKQNKPQQAGWFSSALSSINVFSLLNSLAESGPSQPSMDDPKIKEAMDKAGISKDNPDTQQLMQALAAQQQATGLLQKAQNLKDKAMKMTNSDERQKMIQSAYDAEIAANGQSKMAQRMTSGPWQGGAGGAGIGGCVGMGLGAVLGTVVGGVVSLPTTALGGLVGAGVGGIHGPFIKLNKKKANEVAEREKAKGKNDEEIAEAVQAEAVEEGDGEGAEGEEAVGGAESADAAPQTPTAPANSGAAISQPDSGSAQRNLQRQHSSGTTPTKAAAPAGTKDSSKPKKKPKKLEVRSGNKSGSPAKPAAKANQSSQKS